MGRIVSSSLDVGDFSLDVIHICVLRHFEALSHKGFANFLKPIPDMEPVLENNDIDSP